MGAGYIIGEYPCCEGPLMLDFPYEALGYYSKEKCKHCGADVWHFLSRISPQSWTDGDFHKQFVVDEETKEIKEKDTNEHF